MTGATQDEVKPLFMEGVYSTVGRTTNMELTSLRRQLEVGTDPSFDYTARIESGKEMARRQVRRESSDKDKKKSTQGPLADLENALGISNDENMKRNESGSKSDNESMNKPKIKQTWAFMNQNWDQIKKGEKARKFHPPPFGQYRVKYTVSDPRLLIPDMTKRKKHVGLKTSATMAEFEKLKSEGKEEQAKDLFRHSVSLDHLPSPSKINARMPIYSFDGALGHQEPSKMNMFHYHVNSFDEGVHDAIENSYTVHKPPVFDKYLPHSEVAQTSFFQPGRYKPDLNAVRLRDDKQGVDWLTSTNKVGKPFKKNGQVPAEQPDRSLLRMQHNESYDPRLLIPDMKRQLERDQIPSNKIQRSTSEMAFRPEHSEEVYKNLMEYDASKAELFTRKKILSSNFDKDIRREKAIVGTRRYATDGNIKKALHMQDITSTEQLPLESLDSPICRPRPDICIEHFGLRKGHDNDVGPTQLKESDRPPRLQESKKLIASFGRRQKHGEAPSEVASLSPSNAYVMGQRKERLLSPVRASAEGGHLSPTNPLSQVTSLRDVHTL